MTLKCYYWDTPIGKMITSAPDVETACRQIMATLSKNDHARPELEEALRVEPKLLTDKATTVVIWNQ
jgi:hypothetical protein